VTDVVAVAAVGRNGVIGDGRDIPWRIPEDWRRFRAMTMGQVLIMGRRTFDSIGRPLPGRSTIVVTRDPAWRAAGVRAAPTVPDAFAQARQLHPDTIFVAGGGEIYRAAWDRLDRLEVTEVDQAPVGEVTFPDVDPGDWQEIAREPHDGFSFVTHVRRQERY
jgi:dihydrofolate reductase